MAYTLQAQIRMILDVLETSDAADSPASIEGGNGRTYSGYSKELNLSGNTGSFPEVGGRVADLSKAIGGGGTVDVDLTAAPWAGNINTSVDFTGKKLVAILLAAPHDNAAAIVVAPQGANGYDLFGASGQITVYPGQQYLMASGADATFTVGTEAVGSGAKDIRYTGTAADTLQVLAIFSE